MQPKTKLRIYLEHYEIFIPFFYSIVGFLTMNFVGEQAWLWFQMFGLTFMEGARDPSGG